MKSSLLFGLAAFMLSGLSFAQTDSLNRSEQPLISLDGNKIVKSLSAYLFLRPGFHHHFESGRSDNYTEFRNNYVALGIQGEIIDKLSFQFRQRFNKSGEVQSLEMLNESVEVAYIDLGILPKTNLQFGKMAAYFGGYEYELDPVGVLEYNDIANNLLNYVTGIGLTREINDRHSVGLQILNSRTMRFDDLYEGNVEFNVKEPKWPVALVLNWRGNFMDGKFETIYSLSSFRVAKKQGTIIALTLGNQYKTGKLTLMYDFNYYFEQLDTKGMLTNTIQSETIAEDATYTEHWLRAEYNLTPKIDLLMTVMLSNTYGQNINSENSGLDYVRTSYGVVPTVYYKPFKEVDLKLYFAYIGRSYHYSPYVKKQQGITDYRTNEFQIGVIAPLWLMKSSK